MTNDVGTTSRAAENATVDIENDLQIYEAGRKRAKSQKNCPHRLWAENQMGNPDLII
jgi:hypothetical protein